MAMDCGIYGVVIKLRMFFILFLSLSTFTSTLSSSSSNVQINSNSILVALLDSHYTELAELVEKAMLLQTLEDTISNNIIRHPMYSLTSITSNLPPLTATQPVPSSAKNFYSKLLYNHRAAAIFSLIFFGICTTTEEVPNCPSVGKHHSPMSGLQIPA